MTLPSEIESEEGWVIQVICNEKKIIEPGQSNFLFDSSEDK